MNTITCGSVRDWINQVSRSCNLDPIPDAFAVHIAGCALCRGALLALLATLHPVAQHVTQTTCEECQDDLASYIDLEQEQGTRAAAHAYPHVWWHLIVCSECFSTHHMITLLVEAEQRGELAPMPLAYPALTTPPDHDTRPHPTPPTMLQHTPQLLERLYIPRSFLQTTLAAQPLLGLVRGGGPDDTVLLSEEAPGGYMITLSVQQQSDADWTVIVAVAPPIAGHVLLIFGATTFRAAFNSEGRVTIGNVPAELLTSPNGPDMDLSIELLTAHDANNDT